MTLVSEVSCLLLIDFQSRLMPAIGGAPQLVENAKRLSLAAHQLGIPVFATEQNKRGLGETVEALRGFPRATFQKGHFDMTLEPGWESFLPEALGTIVVCGTEAHVCVFQSVRGLLQHGRRTKVVMDAVGSRTTNNRDAGLHRMERYGAELVTSEMVIFEWLRTCDHPQFRSVLDLVRSRAPSEK